MSDRRHLLSEIGLVETVGPGSGLERAERQAVDAWEKLNRASPKPKLRIRVSDSNKTVLRKLRALFKGKAFGVLFKTQREAERYETLYKRREQLLTSIRANEPDPGCRFGNGEGYKQLSELQVPALGPTLFRAQPRAG